jgi:hypothetical protein
MNSYELAILRILVKRQTPIKIPDLISGFPDNSEYNVMDAISRLHSLGYVSIEDCTHFQRYLLLTKEKRREAIEIISSNISNSIQVRENFYNNQVVNPSIKNNSGTSKTLLLAMMGSTAFSILLLGVIILVSSQSPPLDNLNPSHYVSRDQPSPLLISTFTSSDQYTRSASIPELPDPIVLVEVGGLEEPTTKTMVPKILGATPNSGIFHTIFLEIDTYTEIKSDDTDYNQVI